jgi:serine/threonine protein kinase
MAEDTLRLMAQNMSTPAQKTMRPNDAPNPSPSSQKLVNESRLVRTVTVDEATGERTEIVKSSMGAGEYFGESALLRPEPRNATITAIRDTECLVLSRDQFGSLLGTSLQETIAREAARRARQAASVASANDVQLAHLRLGPLLGVGSFGRVRLVTTAKGDTYALKSMMKAALCDPKEIEHVTSERKILHFLDHPFLPFLLTTYQTADALFLLQELILGGELFTHLEKAGKFEVPAVQFYGGCIVAALTYLHGLDIVYRDLKLENILLDAKGYIKIVDFGFAKVIDDLTWTFCGTPDYLAPETIAGTGHSMSVDWWAFGVLLFEMLTGTAPFTTDDPMSTYRRITELDYSFPWFFDGAAKALINALLTLDPNARLGSTAGMLNRGDRQVREHVFFKPIDFLRLERRELDAPLIPNISSATDVSNFGAVDDARELKEDRKLIRGSIHNSIRPTGDAPTPGSSFSGSVSGSFSNW